MHKEQESFRCLVVKCNCCWCITPQGRLHTRLMLEVALLGRGSPLVCVPFLL